ncbi:hypothetical protein BCR42DRAFT_377969 [Absidia repens]|uniref:Uncharacterized protein n=1 Tax=Absidia repens TaxID=90262 RepID=A0A1X2IC45_9FUNG|nr:hypothetical protein BCR42DRAFT_377969 [Absidia repens]
MPTKSEIVFAIHDFEREHEDEITFYAGESILVIEKDEKYLDGWWQGQNRRGQVGLFPMNYTSPTRSSRMSVAALSLNQQNIPTQQEDTTATTTIATDSYINSNTTNPSMSTPPDTSPSHTNDTVDSSSLSNQTTEQWDVEGVCTWLKSVGLENAVDNFVEQEITGDVLLDLNMDTLKELGITAYGRRYKIMTAINKLTTEKEQSSRTDTGKTANEDANTTEEQGQVPHVSISSGHSPSGQERQYAPSITGSVSSSTTDADVYRSSPRHPRSTLSSSVDTDSLYQYPRKAPAPPSSSTSSSSSSSGGHQHFSHQVNRRPNSGTSVVSNPSSYSNNVSRSNTYNTTSSSGTGTLRSSDHSTQSTFSSQRDINKDAAHPAISFSAPTKSINLHHDHSQQKMSTKMNHPAEQKLSMASIDNPIPRLSADESQAPDHEGWLHKQGDKYKTWNKRWFVLKGTNLFYFKSPKDVRMKGIINLRGYRVIVDETIHSNKYCFKAQHEHERTFFFYTDTQDVMKLWLQALMKATIMRDFTCPVMSSNQVATVPLDVAQRMRPRPPSVIMYKAPPTGNEPMQRVIEEEEPQMDGFPPPSLIDSNFSKFDEPSMQISSSTPTRNINNIDILSDNGDSDEDNIDPYETAQRQNYQQRVAAAEAAAAATAAAKAIGGAEPMTQPSLLTMVPTPEETINKPERSWTNLQYVTWINQYLPEGKKVVDISSAFRNGDTLIVLLESLSNKTVRRNPDQKGGSVSMKILDNIVAAFKFMGREGVVVDGRYTIKDIFGGQEDKILDMMDAIKMWADTNGYPYDHSAAISISTTPPSSSQSNAQSMNLLPETPTDHSDFSKSFYNDTMHHITDSIQHHPQHVA